jgi:transmembrane sensor
MNGPTSENLRAVTQTADVDACAADWVTTRHDSGNWSEEVDASFNAWLAQSPVHEVAYMRLEAAWISANRFAALRPGTPEVARGRQARRMPPLLMRVMAALIVVVGGGFLVANYSMPVAEQRIYETAIGQRETISLPDGSRVELNTDTRLRLADAGDRRAVFLDRGEAYFRIKHDPVRPFVVMLGEHRVTDLGTEFVIRRSAQRLEVAVVEGRALFDAPGITVRPSSIELKAGEGVLATLDSVKVTKASANALSDGLGWRRGVLIFDHKTLADAAAEFNRYNRQKLFIDDPVVARKKIDGTFPMDDAELFSRSVQRLFGLHIVKYGGEIVITR